METTTVPRRFGRAVPVAWRQLAAEPAKLFVTLAAVAAAVALVLLLVGLRRGIAEQTTLYIDRQAPVLVGQKGARNFISQPSVLPERLGARIARVPGVADVTPITDQFGMLRLHGKRVLSFMIGYDPGRPGGPWKLAEGRRPRAPRELVLDRVLASSHGLEVGSTLRFRGAKLRVVGLSTGTSGWMLPLVFATRASVNALNEQSGTATFFLVEPRKGIPPNALAERIDRALPQVSATPRSRLAANDRRLFISVLNGPLLAMVAIAIAVAILVIGLSVYSSTAEREREYATLKAIGLVSRKLLRLAAVQAGGLALAGTVAGALLALAGKWLVAELAPKYLIAITATSVGLMALGALAMAVVAASATALYLARLDPASAFRR